MTPLFGHLAQLWQRLCVAGETSPRDLAWLLPPQAAGPPWQVGLRRGVALELCGASVHQSLGASLRLLAMLQQRDPGACVAVVDAGMGIDATTLRARGLRRHTLCLQPRNVAELCVALQRLTAAGCLVCAVLGVDLLPGAASRAAHMALRGLRRQRTQAEVATMIMVRAGAAPQPSPCDGLMSLCQARLRCA